MPKGYMGNGYFEFSGVLIFNSMEGEYMNIRALFIPLSRLIRQRELRLSSGD